MCGTQLSLSQAPAGPGQHCGLVPWQPSEPSLDMTSGSGEGRGCVPVGAGHLWWRGSSDTPSSGVLIVSLKGREGGREFRWESMPISEDALERLQDASGKGGSRQSLWSVRLLGLQQRPPWGSATPPHGA